MRRRVIDFRFIFAHDYLVVVIHTRKGGMKMASASAQRYVRMTIKCPNCDAKLAVHIAARTGFKQMNDQTVSCVKCEDIFPVMLPDTIIDGPFLEA